LLASRVGYLHMFYISCIRYLRDQYHFPTRRSSDLIGLASLGHKVMATVGTGITHLTPSRGFAAQLATAATVVIASGTGLPISTTDRKSTRLNSSHVKISYAVFCLKKKKQQQESSPD